MRASREQAVGLEALDAHGVIGDDGAIALEVECRSLTGRRLKGELTITAFGHRETKRVKIARKGSRRLTFRIPASALTGRWGAAPIYMVFRGKRVFAAAHALLYYSRIIPAADKPFVAKAGDFHPLAGKSSRSCPVSRAAVRYDGKGVEIEFKWKDEKTILARPEFKHRFGFMIKAPLDLGSRGGQPCDAVDFIFDLRPDASTGRFTSSVDANPEGVVRIGVYKVEENGEVRAKLVAKPALKHSEAVLTAKGNDTYLLRFTRRSKGSAVGFSMRVTDADRYHADAGPVYRLTGLPDVSHEPMSFVRLGAEGPGIFYRVGY